MRESLIALLQSPDKDNRMAAIEMNKGLHLIDDILKDFESISNVLKIPIEDYFIKNENWVWKVNIEFKNIKELPHIPLTIKELHCAHNFSLTHLPNLHEGLEVLNCGSCGQLKSLPSLPQSLNILDCNGCNLMNLPILPPNLKNLRCSYNILRNLPKLPPNLKILQCDYNKLKKIEDLPKNLEWLTLSNNDFSLDEMTKIQRLYPNIRF